MEKYFICLFVIIMILISSVTTFVVIYKRLNDMHERSKVINEITNGMISGLKDEIDVMDDRWYAIRKAIGYDVPYFEEKLMLAEKINNFKANNYADSIMIKEFEQKLLNEIKNKEGE